MMTLSTEVIHIYIYCNFTCSYCFIIDHHEVVTDEKSNVADKFGDFWDGKLNKRKRGNFRMKKKKHFVRLAKINCGANTVYMYFSFKNINE